MNDSLINMLQSTGKTGDTLYLRDIMLTVKFTLYKRNILSNLRINARSRHHFEKV